jgi:hypothetical protein
MRWTQDAERDVSRGRAVFLCTAKSCGPGIPTLMLSLRDDDLVSDGGKKARSPGRARINRKTIAQGRPVASGFACGFPPVHSYATWRTGGHGCQPAPGLPCALLISEGLKTMHYSGVIAPRERGSVPQEMRATFSAVIARESGRSSSVPSKIDSLEVKVFYPA